MCHDSRHAIKDQPIVQHGGGTAAAASSSAARWERRSPFAQSVSTPTALNAAAGAAAQCTVCCNCSKDTQSHCCCCPLVPPPPACAASWRRRTLWQCLCVECCKRASWSPHLAPKSFDEKKISVNHSLP